MKIKNILLPIATATSVAAIVTPIVASCGNQKGDFYQDVTDYLREGGTYFKRTTKVIPLESETTWTNDKATVEYLKAIKGDKQIFYDDVFETLFGEDALKYATWIKVELEGTFGLSFYDTDPDNMKLSAGVFADLKGTEWIQQMDEPISEVKFDVKGNIQLSNIPVQISYGPTIHSEDPVWSMQMAPQKFGKDFGIKGKGYFKQNIDDLNVNINLDCDYTNDSSAFELLGLDYILNEILGNVTLEIPYLKNVKHGQEPDPQI